MTRQATVYEILIASPSDTTKERLHISEAIHSWNTVNSLSYGIILEPVLWETHATPEMGDRPQAIINRQLVESCDILVGVFWTRLGTHTGKAESGTVEEIEEFRKAEKPVLLYFSSIPVVLQSIDIGQYTKLLEFKKQCQNNGLVFEFDSPDNLRELLQKHLTSKINSLHKVSSETNAKKEDDQHSALKIFKSQYDSFLRRLESEWKAERDSNPFNIDEGKYILERACLETLNFRSQIVEDKGMKLSETLDEAIKSLKAIQRHKLRIDGGHSFKVFWEEGTQIVDLLKKVSEEII